MKKRTAVSDQEKFYEVIVISPTSSRRSSHREQITGNAKQSMLQRHLSKRVRERERAIQIAKEKYQI